LRLSSTAKEKLSRRPFAGSVRLTPDPAQPQRERALVAGCPRRVPREIRAAGPLRSNTAHAAQVCAGQGGAPHGAVAIAQTLMPRGGANCEYTGRRRSVAGLPIGARAEVVEAASDPPFGHFGGRGARYSPAARDLKRRTARSRPCVGDPLQSSGLPVAQREGVAGRSWSR